MKIRLKNFYLRHKKKIFTALRIIISVGLITYLVVFKSGFKDFANFANILKDINIPLILASASLHIFGTWISAVRWQILLGTQGVGYQRDIFYHHFWWAHFLITYFPPV